MLDEGEQKKLISNFDGRIEVQCVQWIVLLFVQLMQHLKKTFSIKTPEQF